MESCTQLFVSIVPIDFFLKSSFRTETCAVLLDLFFLWKLNGFFNSFLFKSTAIESKRLLMTINFHSLILNYPMGSSMYLCLVISIVIKTKLCILSYATE